MIPNKIFELLDQNIDLCRDFAQALREEDEALRNIQVNSIQKLARRKDELLGRIARLDAALGDIVSRLAGEKPHELPDLKGRYEKAKPTALKINLSSLIPLATGSQAPLFKEKSATLKELRRDIADRNVINRRFIADVLGFLRDSVTMLNDAIAKEVSYGVTLPGSRPLKRPAFISREV